MKKRITLLQHLLREEGWYPDEPDGLYGPKTANALQHIPELQAQWPADRKVIAALQWFAEQHNIKARPIDGLWGPVTQVAYDLLSAQVANKPAPVMWRPEEIIEVNPNAWPRQYSPEFEAFYGAQGEQLVSIDLPYPHKLSWKTRQKIEKFQCHQKVADSLSRVLANVLGHYGLQEIQRLRLDVWGGCFNIRPIRGGSRPSMHSWGIAVDYDPNRNRLQWGRDKAAFAHADYQRWWEFWEAEGWLSLGRSRNFDWMHVQAAKL